jgi:RimK family alpha-L-glutamate ligase
MPCRHAERTIPMMTRIGIVGWNQDTNRQLAAAWCERGFRADLLSPPHAMCELRAGDVALGRLDVRRTLDGVEPGLIALRVAANAGARVLNTPSALQHAHDKLSTAAALRHAHVPHPLTIFVPPAARAVRLAPPLVLKPRYGSWGEDVLRCDTSEDVAHALEEIRNRPWFRRRGALAQELIPMRGLDLRMLVAAGRMVGAVERIAAPGEWRTNVSLGGTRRPVDPPEEAVRLAVAAVEAIGADFVGVDVLPTGSGYVVLEVNGAVEFDSTYDLPGGDVYLDAAQALDLIPNQVAA